MRQYKPFTHHKEPKPIGYPTVIGPSGNWITDPEWIASNARKVMSESNLEE